MIDLYHDDAPYPDIGEPVIIFHNNDFDIAYRVNEESKPRKWRWYSYKTDDSIDEVRWYYPLPEEPEA